MAPPMGEIDQLTVLQAANRSAPDAAVERRLVQLRTTAFARQRQVTPRQIVPPGGPDGALYGLPVIAASQLDIPVVRHALGEYGALHVRGLFDARRVALMRRVIDNALAAQEAAYSGAQTAETAPWYDPSDAVIGGEVSRAFVRLVGSVLVADSPRGLFHLLETFYDIGLDRLVTEYFGERPGLSQEKATLRRVVPEPEPGGWHQDGRFLGTAIRALNVWVALSDCGTEAPGLEVVPKRLHRIVETGTEGAAYDWVASHAMVERQFPGSLIRPEFAAGDALLFDHFLMHRTWRAASMTQPRYAIESWFFAPSAYPESQTGLYV